MPAAFATAALTAAAPGDVTPFDRRLGEILHVAAELFAEQGYAASSIRDLSRRSGASLAGLYHYFHSKEELLFLVQRHAFQTVIAAARAAAPPALAPEARLRAFITSHLETFLAHRPWMTVLTHEDAVLGGEYHRAIAALKHDYYQLALEIVTALPLAPPLTPRVAVMSLFGTLNWVYTWHQPRRDPGAAGLAEQISSVFLRGAALARRRRAQLRS
ncbi:MAG: TetR/AcrR family transcriptional regulator [Terriglobales bacterium]